MKDLVQIKNPKIDRWVKIDKATGTIVSHKKSKGPYKGIKIAGKKRKDMNEKLILKKLDLILEKLDKLQEKLDEYNRPVPWDKDWSWSFTEHPLEYTPDQPICTCDQKGETSAVAPCALHG